MARTEDVIRRWDRLAGQYDRRSAAVEERFLAASRPWLASRAHGRTLEAAVGTGLNLPHYPAGLELTATDLSEGMLAEARARTARLGRAVELVLADITDLPFEDGHFDSVVCTYALCEVADERAAVRELVRVLRPGGSLLLADHVVATAWWLRAGQAVVEAVSAPLLGEHLRRRPLLAVQDEGLAVVESERTHRGLMERLHARKPG